MSAGVSIETPSGVRESVDQALYDKVHLAPGPPVEELAFFYRSVGHAARLIRGGAARDVTAGLGDTNVYSSGTLGPHGHTVTGIVLRLHAHPWHEQRALAWWRGAAQGAHFSLRIVDRVYLDLPATDLPVLGAFDSPFAWMAETLTTYDGDGKILERRERSWTVANHWPLSPAPHIGPFMHVAALLRFPASGMPAPPVELDLELLLLGTRWRDAL